MATKKERGNVQIEEKLVIQDHYRVLFMRNEGKILNKIYQISGATEIWFPEATHSRSNGFKEKYEVKIRGTKKAVDCAKSLIKLEIRKAGDFYSIMTTYPHHLHSTIIGKEGEKIKKICEKFNVNILTPFQEDVYNNTFIFQGFFRDVFEARKAVDDAAKYIMPQRTS